MQDTSNSADVIDSRDVTERIAELEADEERDDEDTAELQALRAFAEEASQCAPDWEYGEACIRESYFTKYAQKLADDLGIIDNRGPATWPLYCIDWEWAAKELLADYTAVDYDGVTYYVR